MVHLPVTSDRSVPVIHLWSGVNGPNKLKSECLTVKEEETTEEFPDIVASSERVGCTISDTTKNPTLCGREDRWVFGTEGGRGNRVLETVITRRWSSRGHRGPDVRSKRER